MCREEVVTVVVVLVVVIVVVAVVERPTQKSTENSQTIFLMSNDIRIQTHTHSSTTASNSFTSIPIYAILNKQTHTSLSLSTSHASLLRSSCFLS